MIDTRKVSTLGIGFGTLAIATIGLLPTIAPPSEPCGGVCSSIILGHFQLGCSPITGKFDLNCTYTLPPIPPPSGGGGGYVGANWGNLRHLTPKLRECNQEVDMLVQFNDGISFEQHYVIDVCNTKARARAKVLTTTNMAPPASKVTASFVKTESPVVTAAFIPHDK